MKKSSKPEILCDHSDFLVVNKPCGWAVQGKDQDLIGFYHKRYNKDLHPISRIDQPVSGIALLAKNKKAAAKLSAMQTVGTIQKIYWAIVEGVIPQNDLEINIPLAKKGQKAMADEKGKPAYTKAKVIWRGDRYTGLEVSCETGRFHQIRAHFAAIGHPIKGDIKYGSKRTEKEGGIYLHCAQINFPFPNFEGSCTAAVPEDKTLFLLLAGVEKSTESAEMPIE